MGAVTSVLFKVLVKKFYERNAGFLFFVFYLMFGVVESNQIVSYHHALMYAVVTSPIFLVSVMLVWLLYSAKCLQLVLAELAEPHNQFLKDYSRLNRGQQFWPMLVAVALMDEPVLIYTAFVVGVGIANAQYLPTMAILLFHLAKLVVCVWIILRRLNALHERTSTQLTLGIPWPGKKYFPFFYLSHFSNQMPLALLFTKAFSLFAIIGFLQINTDHYDNRTALMGLLFGLMAHSVIIFESRRWEETYLSFARGLPLSIGKRFRFLAGFYALLLLPEMVLLMVNKFTWYDVAGIVFFAINYLVYQHTRLYARTPSIDKHTTFTFALFLFSFMLVLFKLYWVEAFALSGLGFYHYQRDYYNFDTSM